MIRNDDDDDDDVDVEHHHQQQQQQQQQPDDTAILPDYKDQARPHLHSHTTAATTKRPIPTMARTVNDDKKKKSHDNLNRNTHPNQHGHQNHDDPIEGQVEEGDQALPLAQAIPISRFADTDSVSIDVDTTTNNNNNNNNNNGDNDNYNHIGTDFLPVALPQPSTVTAKRSATNTNSIKNGRDGSDSSSTLLVLTLKISRTTVKVIILIVVLVVSATVIGVVCGTGNCSRPKTKAASGENTSNTPVNNVIYTDDNTSSGGSPDDDSDDDTFGIKSYLRSISLTNASLQGSGNNNDYDDILKQADEMAINWIVNEYVTVSNTTTNSNTIINISDPMSQQRVTQLFAIVTLFYSTNNINNENGMNWTTATNWLQSDVHECEWYGIICNNTDVSDPLTDDISVEILNRRLEPVDSVDDNSTGNSDHGNRRKLSSSVRIITSISLPMNNIGGPINPNLGLLTDLTALVLSDNLITGTIPTTLATCTNLMKFRIEQNTISGTLPNEIVTLWSDSIRRFHVGSNMLTGTIPSAIGLWNGIRSFAIDKNQFTGTIPATIRNWTNIQTVQLNSNNLTGSIPDELCALFNEDGEIIIVDQFEINCTCCYYENVITSVPETVVPTTNVPKVSPLPAPSSPIFAAFPVVVLTPTTATTNAPTNPSAFTTLQSYIVSVTSMNGGGGTNPNSPTQMAELAAIQWLEDNNNNSTLQWNPNDAGGQFRIRQWYALLTLYYSTNGPSWFVNWENNRGTNECLLAGINCSMLQDTSGNEQLVVVFIRLPQNSLQGRLPNDLSLLSHLQTIELSGNALSGTIPDVFITSTPSMNTFIMDNNRMTGTLSTSLGASWTNMLQYNVANNTIGGSIPESLSQWSDSTEIILSGNMITGTIPSSICTKSFVTPIVLDEDLPPCNN